MTDIPGPIADTSPRAWSELRPEEQTLLQGINAFVGQAIAQADGIASTPHRQRPPRIDRQRFGRVAMLDGMRGTGKTTLLLTLLEAWARVRDGDDVPQDVPDEIRRVGSQLAMLDLLDFDPQPEGLPIYAWLIQAFGPLIDALDRAQGKPKRCDDDHIAYQWSRLVETAALGWSPGARWPLPSSDTGADSRQRTSGWVRLGEAWRRFIDKLIEVDPETRLIIVPVDDVDMQPSGALDLLQAMRVFYHPRVLFLMTGDRRQLLDVMREELQRRHAHDAPLLARALLDKTVPRAHAFPVEALTWAEALDWYDGALRKRLARVMPAIERILPAKGFDVPTLPIRAVAQLAGHVEDAPGDDAVHTFGFADDVRARALLAELIERARPSQLALSPTRHSTKLEPLDPKETLTITAQSQLFQSSPGLWRAEGVRFGHAHTGVVMPGVALALEVELTTDRVTLAPDVDRGLLAALWQTEEQGEVFVPWPMMALQRPSDALKLQARLVELMEGFISRPGVHVQDETLWCWIMVHIEWSQDWRPVDKEKYEHGKPQAAASGDAFRSWSFVSELISLGNSHASRKRAFGEWLSTGLPLLAAPEFGLSPERAQWLLDICQRWAAPESRALHQAGALTERGAPWEAERQRHIDSMARCREGYFNGLPFKEAMRRRHPEAVWFEAAATAAPPVEEGPVSWLDAHVNGRLVRGYWQYQRIGDGEQLERWLIFTTETGGRFERMEHWGIIAIGRILDKVADWPASVRSVLTYGHSDGVAYWLRALWRATVEAAAQVYEWPPEAPDRLRAWVDIDGPSHALKWYGSPVTCEPAAVVDPDVQNVVGDVADLNLRITRGWQLRFEGDPITEPDARDALGMWAVLIGDALAMNNATPPATYRLPLFDDPKYLPDLTVHRWVDAEYLRLSWLDAVEQASATWPEEDHLQHREALLHTWFMRVIRLMATERGVPASPTLQPDYASVPASAGELANHFHQIPKGLLERSKRSAHLADWLRSVNLRWLVSDRYAEDFERVIAECLPAPEADD